MANFLYVFLFSIFMIHFSTNYIVECDKSYRNINSDQSVLLSLKASLVSVNNVLSTNWTTYVSVCHWIGVTCGPKHHRVVALDISNMRLSGPLPTTIGNLSFLSSLNMSNNHLHGNIPNALSRLQRLKILDLSSNNLTGAIPASIFNVSMLEYINFRFNSFSGTLPSNICQSLRRLEVLILSKNQLHGSLLGNLSACSSLRDLVLSYNTFTGLIPRELGELQMLETLYIGSNNLTGSIPSTIFDISSLEELSLWGNRLTGSIPREIGNLSSIRILELSQNYFTGAIPREISRLSELKLIGLYLNNLTGIIPKEIFNISTLNVIDLSSNLHLSGNIPQTICSKQPNLEEIYLDENMLTGLLPSSLGNCTKLSTISLSKNRFVGSIPNSLENLRFLEYLLLRGNRLAPEPASRELSFITSLTKCENLRVIDLGYNILNGTLPRSIGNLSSTLRIFEAYNSGFYGTIPEDIGNLTSVEYISMYANKLSGHIPSTIGRLQGLARLYLGMNRLSGPFPRGLCELQGLGEVDLTSNVLAGSIPECLGNVTSLRYLYLDCIGVSGEIPQSLWNLKDLLVLRLSSNSLTGVLHPEIRNLRALYLLDLSNNKISGSIPSTIGSLQSLINVSLAENRFHGRIPEAIGGILSLESLDLSYNNLSGPVPKSLQAIRYLHYFNVSFNSLAGEIPSNGPFRNFTSSSFMFNEALCGESRFGVPPCQRPNAKKSLRNIYLAVGIVGVILALTLGIVLLIICRKKIKVGKQEDKLVAKTMEKFTYYELFRATNGYSEASILGEGSYGVVYKGVLENGRDIAVKVFKSHEENNFLSTFDTECEVLCNIRHRNLTKVLSSCSNPDFKALVLEYMPNGSFEKWLYSEDCFLDTIQRLNVMIDVAYALEYLHHECHTPVVHCDLKPSNVLLDENMVGHISDFGIAKLLSSEDGVVYTRTIATLGYIAPEYGTEGMVSTRCDVYSYGIMLMEAFVGKKPNDEIFSGDITLQSWVKEALPDKVIDVIDSRLIAQNVENLSAGKIKFFSSIMELGLTCSFYSAIERINMKDVCLALHKIKRMYFSLH